MISLVISLMISFQKGEKGDIVFEFILATIGTIVGGVICHYIIKWLDSPKDDK